MGGVREGLIVLAGALALSGCAMTPPEPCTSAWYDYEAREAFKPIRQNLGRALTRLEGAQAALQADAGAGRAEPGLGTMVSLAFALESGLSVLEATQTETLPRLQAASATCNNAAFVRRAVFDFLEAEGVEDLFTQAEGFAPLAQALDQMLAGQALTGS